MTEAQTQVEPQERHENAPMSSLYPIPSKTALKQHFQGKNIANIDSPVAILDIAVIKKNCSTMLQTAQDLSLSFRAHVKTHKTVEVTRLQIGDKDAGRSGVKVVVSTIAEAEMLFPLLMEYQRRGTRMVYGIPPSSSAFARLRPMRRALGQECISFLIDHPAHLQYFVDGSDDAPTGAVPVFVKVDVGYHRAGLAPESEPLDALLKAIAQSHHIKIIGVYSHNSLSYAASSPEEALQYLTEELTIAARAADQVSSLTPTSQPLIISVGATPTTASTQVLLQDSQQSMRVHNLLSSLRSKYDVELHAGVYALLDLQQLAARSTPKMTASAIALRIQAEVLSVYTDRAAPEALIGAGTLALGHEPCKSYDGWGVVVPDPSVSRSSREVKDHEREPWKQGWVVGRISQEHGVLTWAGDATRRTELSVGQKVLVWPNHACIAAAGFGWFLIVDSESDEPERVIDVWVRCRGW